MPQLHLRLRGHAKAPLHVLDNLAEGGVAAVRHQHHVLLRIVDGQLQLQGVVLHAVVVGVGGRLHHRADNGLPADHRVDDAKGLQEDEPHRLRDDDDVALLGEVRRQAKLGVGEVLLPVVAVAHRGDDS